MVALAGQRPTGGYSVDVPRVTWRYPAPIANVRVVETLPFEMAIQVVTSPYTIVVLDEKVYLATVDWQTKQPRLPGPTEP